MNEGLVILDDQGHLTQAALEFYVTQPYSDEASELEIKQIEVIEDHLLTGCEFCFGRLFELETKEKKVEQEIETITQAPYDPREHPDDLMLEAFVGQRIDNHNDYVNILSHIFKCADVECRERLMQAIQLARFGLLLHQDKVAMDNSGRLLSEELLPELGLTEEEFRLLRVKPDTQLDFSDGVTREIAWIKIRKWAREQQKDQI